MKIGQFNTVKSDLILLGFEDKVKDQNVFDPFAGDGDLLKWALRNGAKSARGVDIDESKKTKPVLTASYDITIQIQDSFKIMANNEKFIVMNPPFLAKNKMSPSTKRYLSGSKHEDLYQLGLQSIIGSIEGIAIVPINFFSSENSSYIRHEFFNKYQIEKCNFFTYQVFEHTTYNVVAFYFYPHNNINFQKQSIEMNIFNEDGSKYTEIYTLTKKTDWKIGGEFLNQVNETNNVVKLSRLVEQDLIGGSNEIKFCLNDFKHVKSIGVDDTTNKKIENNIILLKAIDDFGSPLGLEDIRKYKYPLVGKHTSRNLAHIIFEKPLSIEVQQSIIEKFNMLLTQQRDKYQSLFLTNFRDRNRKRVSFDFAYKLINLVYLQITEEAK